MKRINSDLVLLISFFVIAVIFDFLYRAFGIPSLIQDVDNEVAYFILSAVVTVAGIGIPMSIIYILVRRLNKVQPLTKKERKYFWNGLLIFVVLVGVADYLISILQLIPDEGIGRLFSLILLVVLIIWYNQKCVDTGKRNSNVGV